MKPSDDDVWFHVGDYNGILNQLKKEGGNIIYDFSFGRFHGWMFDYNLLDMEFKGSKFTWSNRQFDGSFVREMLDRAFCNVNFRNLFPSALLVHNEMVSSDHAFYW